MNLIDNINGMLLIDIIKYQNKKLLILNNHFYIMIILKYKLVIMHKLNYN